MKIRNSPFPNITTHSGQAAAPAALTFDFGLDGGEGRGQVLLFRAADGIPVVGVVSGPRLRLVAAAEYTRLFQCAAPDSTADVLAQLHAAVAKLAEDTAADIYFDVSSCAPGDEDTWSGPIAAVQQAPRLLKRLLTRLEAALLRDAVNSSPQVGGAPTLTAPSHPATAHETRCRCRHPRLETRFVSNFATDGLRCPACGKVWTRARLTQLIHQHCLPRRHSPALALEGPRKNGSDFVMAPDADVAWITVGAYSIRLGRDGDAVRVAIWPLNDEARAEPLAACAAGPAPEASAAPISA